MHVTVHRRYQMTLFSGSIKVWFNHWRVTNDHDKHSCNSVTLKYLFPFQQWTSMLLNEKAWLTK